MADVRLYEAVVVDGNPDPNLPGHIEVRIPELYGNEAVAPTLIPPLYPGASFGGWQSVPQASNPDEPEAEVRVVVAHMGLQTFRWLGTSQPFSAIAADPANRVGARSKDGRHSIFMDSVLGTFISIGSDNVATSTFIVLDPTDDSITMTTATGAVVQISENLIHLQNLAGDVLQLDDTNGVKLMHNGGIASLDLRTGDVAALSGSAVQINGGTIEMGGGVIPPVHPYLLTLLYLADISASLAEIVAVFAVPGPLIGPLPLPTTAATIVKIATSLSTGAPYLSIRISGD